MRNPSSAAGRQAIHEYTNEKNTPWWLAPCRDTKQESMVREGPSVVALELKLR